MANDYTFPQARRLVMVQLTHEGEVLPVVRVRNAKGAMEPDGDPVEKLPLKSNQALEFTVNVESGIGTEGFLSTELCDWGPDVYMPITAAFIGKTWPFGQQDYKPIASNPGAKQISAWNYTFAKSGDQWVLRSEAKVGDTVQNHAITVVPKGGGAVACVVLRLAGASKGTMTFNRGFGPDDKRVWGWEKALPLLPDGDGVSDLAVRTTAAGAAIISAVAARSPDLRLATGGTASGLSEALATVFRQYEANWKAAGAAGIPQESLEPIRQAIFQHAVEQTLAELRKTTSTADVS